MAVTRRRFLMQAGRAGGASLVYEAMTGLGLLAAPSQAPFNLTGRVSGVRVVILGAGLSGMTAAYELGKVGFDCRVLEARARPGGRVFTVRRGTASEETGSAQTAGFDEGQYFNAGPARFPQWRRAGSTRRCVPWFWVVSRFDRRTPSASTGAFLPERCC